MQSIGMKVDPITPTEAELKETGVFQEAQHELMRGPETEWDAQQRKYIDEMASEMGLKLISKREYAQLQRIMQQPKNHKYVKNGKKPPHLKRQFARTVQKTRIPQIMQIPRIQLPPPFRLTVPKTVIPIFPPQPFRRKKRQRLHTGRNGKTPRRLKKLIQDGKKHFSFPDHIWKVRQPRKQRRTKTHRRRKR